MEQPIAETRRLIGRVKEGDAEALDALFARYADRVRVIARNRLNPRLRRLADSADVMQEVLVAAMRGIEDFEVRSEGAFLHWLGKNCSNRIKDLARRGGRKRRDMDREVALDAPVDGGGGESAGSFDLPAEDATPSMSVAATERDQLVASVLDELPEDSRELLLMRDFEGQSWAEIAERLGCNDDAARKRHSTAKVRFARVWKERGVSGEGL